MIDYEEKIRRHRLSNEFARTIQRCGDMARLLLEEQLRLEHLMSQLREDSHDDHSQAN